MAERKIYVPSYDPVVIAQQRMAQGQALREAAVNAGDALIETAGEIADAAIAAGKTAIEFITGVEGPKQPLDIKDEPVSGACVICQREARDRANEESNVLHNESTEGNSEESPGRRKPEGKASELPVTKKGTKEWKDAVKDIKTSGKGKDYSVGSKEDAEDLLGEARPDLEEKPTYSKKKNPYKSGYEHHPNESHTPNASHNDKPHIAWQDYPKGKGKAAGAKGHIFYP